MFSYKFKCFLDFSESVISVRCCNNNNNLIKGGACDPKCSLFTGCYRIQENIYIDFSVGGQMSALFWTA